MKNLSIFLLALASVFVISFLVWPKTSQDDSTPNSEIDHSLEVLQDKKDMTQKLSQSEQKSLNDFSHKNEQTKADKASVPEAQTVVQTKPKAKEETELQEKLENYGTFPPADMTKMNPHKEHLLEALQNPSENGGAISQVGKREKFDLARYKQEPEYYLNTVEPGRAFDAAQASPEVKKISRVGYSSVETRQNETITLKAKGEKGMPISFTVFDGGVFQNGLGYITLKADENGVAKAEYTPTTGVINQTRIRAASPVNSGTLQWTVFVRHSQINN